MALFFFFNDTTTTEIYTLSLHDALPIFEHEPEDIWNSTFATCREALKKANVTARDIAAIGITNQRETTVVWDRDRKSTRLNSSHRCISYAVFCLKKKKNIITK